MEPKNNQENAGQNRMSARYRKMRARDVWEQLVDRPSKTHKRKRHPHALNRTFPRHTVSRRRGKTFVFISNAARYAYERMREEVRKDFLAAMNKPGFARQVFLHSMGGRNGVRKEFGLMSLEEAEASNDSVT